MFKKIGSFPPAIVLAALVAAAAGFLTYHGALGTDESAAPSALSESSSEQEVLGDPIDCAVGEDTQFKFETEANEFEVIGLLVSFDGETAVVAGPSGDVSATLAANFELEGALATTGTNSERAVKMEGTVEGSQNVAREIKSACDGVGVINCAVGEDPLRKLEVEGDTFEVTGTLNAPIGSLVSVVGPGVIVEANASGAEIDIPLTSPADTPVKVEGSVLGPDSFLAREIQSPCEEEQVVQPPPLAVLEECNRGPGQAGELRLKVEGDEIEIERGTVINFAGGVLTVQTADGPMTVTIEAGTRVDGDLSLAEEVRVEGTLTNGSTILAERVKALCPDAAHDADNDDNDEGDERGQDNEGPDDDDGDNSGPSGNSGEDGSGGGGNSGPN